MKKLLQLSVRVAGALALVVLASTILEAQATDENPFQPGTSVEKVFNWYTGIYMAAVAILTRLQAAFFPNAGAVPKVAVRYILIAGVLGILFITLGFTNAWGVAIGFVGAALAYDKVLEPLGILKTPKPILK